MTDLRQGLIDALQHRSRRQRTILLSVTLIDGVNDSPSAAQHLADFCQPILHHVPGVKLVVNLIPWNDIHVTTGPAAGYRRPSDVRVAEFQHALVQRGIRTMVRTTRGDDESAACGQLSTRVDNQKVQRDE